MTINELDKLAELVKQEGLSLKRAAELLGTSVTAVKLRTHRAYEALRAVLREAMRILRPGGVLPL